MKLKIILAVFFGATLFFSMPHTVVATIGESCCGQYNQYIPSTLSSISYRPNSSGSVCVSPIGPSGIGQALRDAGFCTVVGPNPILMFFCNVPDSVNSLPISCSSDEVCNPSSRLCDSPSNPSGIVVDPICAKGYKDVTEIGGVVTLATNLVGWDQTKGRVCCKADVLDQVISPLKCLNTTNIAYGTSCQDSRFAFQSSGPNAGRCVKLTKFGWEPLSCNGVAGVDTAIGCVPTGDLKAFLEWILKYVFFASGGIIVLMVIATGYTIITSQGNPEKLQAAKENIVALLSGFGLIVFSLILLQVIGANVLGLPTF